MTPAVRIQLIIGAVATAAVAVLSYFVVKRRAVRDQSAGVPREGVNKNRAEGDASAGVENISSEGLQESQHQDTLQAREGESNNDNGQGKKDKLADEEQGQTSFIVLDNGEEAVPPDNGQHPKKSDRSSDESSYDVIDDEQLGETVEEGEGVEDGEKSNGSGHAEIPEMKPRDSFVDENETSMVIIEELDQSNQSKSGSSFYASADENTEMNKSEEIKNEEKEELIEGAPEVTTVTPVDIESSLTDHSLSVSKEDEAKNQKIEEDVGRVCETEEPVSTDVAVSIPEESTSDFSFVDTTETVTSRLNVVLKPETGTVEESTARDDVELEADQVTNILTMCQNSPSTVSKENIRLLVSLLRKKIPELHSTVLNCVLRVAAFTQNVKTLRESGCLKEVADQVQDACRNINEVGADTLNSLCQVLTNLTLDPKCQAELEGTVPVLIDLFLSTDSEPVKLYVLRPLINFSSQSGFHSHYVRAVQDLYVLLDTGSHVAKIQSVKILVNLSLNENTVPHLLAAKAPVKLVELLDLPTPADLTLRTLTLLANIKLALHKGSGLLASVPEEVKTASPETVYMALHSSDRLPALRSKVLRLTRHSDEDIALQASKLSQFIQDTAASARQ